MDDAANGPNHLLLPSVTAVEIRIFKLLLVPTSVRAVGKLLGVSVPKRFSAAMRGFCEFFGCFCVVDSISRAFLLFSTRFGGFLTSLLACLRVLRRVLVTYRGVCFDFYLVSEIIPPVLWDLIWLVT